MHHMIASFIVLLLNVIVDCYQLQFEASDMLTKVSTVTLTCVNFKLNHKKFPGNLPLAVNVAMVTYVLLC